MTNEPKGFRGLERSLLNRISNTVCSSAARTRHADLKRLAGGDLATMLGDIRDEFRNYRTLRATTLLQRVAA